MRNNNNMCSFVFLIFIVSCGVVQGAMYQLEEEECETPTGWGTCKLIAECPHAQDDLKKGMRPQLCGFSGKAAKVCCPPEASTPQPSPPSDYEDYDDSGLLPGAECRPIPRNATRVPKTGQKARDKCIGYLQYVYPCELTETLSARKDMARRYQCLHNETRLAEGARRVTIGEIPHMALLGYGLSIDTASWGCAGTIISERYILTAATCIISKENDMVRFVHVGLVNIPSKFDDSRIHNISKFISHPKYNRLLDANNIGLVQTATPIIFDNQVYPACLHIGDTIDDAKMMAAGWGLLNYGGSPGSGLHKVTLDKINSMECYQDGLSRLRKKQICAGYPADVSGICQVDPGSPLQILNQDVDCMYTILGVASFGPKCGTGTENGVFVRVSPFRSWIENVVWS